MQEPQPILTAHLFDPINTVLVSLLRRLQPDEWEAPTVAGSWNVRAVTAHLLDTTLRRLARHRDAFEPPLPPDAFASGLVGFVNDRNHEGVAVLSRLSAPLLIELHEIYGSRMAAFFETLDPLAPAKWSVSWAGEEVSPTWFDIARELTERWHHQQQIRDAIGAAPLYEDRFLGPVIDTFVRALPYAFRSVHAAEKTAVVLRIVEEGTGSWSLVRTEGHWRLFVGEVLEPATRITIRGDLAWRLFTKGLTPESARAATTVEGDPSYAKAFREMVCIIG